MREECRSRKQSNGFEIMLVCQACEITGRDADSVRMFVHADDCAHVRMRHGKVG